ncbi:FUSC family protein [Streptomyces sp. NPDC101225]|uniref:FUSC family protein n=1 Tax=Streptomyces sp. NPDC101225 TaxID=3366135 RepID=UPI0038283BD6
MKQLIERDPGLLALRRSGRAAIVAAGLFAIAVEVIGNDTMAVFAAFGAIALLLFADLGGSPRDRLALQGMLTAAGATLVCIGTLASRTVWLAALMAALVAFAVLFAGVVSSVLAGSSTALLASFILAVTLPGGPGTIPERLVGYLMAGAASLVAVTLLWPAPTRDPLRRSAARSCRFLARRLRAEADCARGDSNADQRLTADETTTQATAAVSELRATFYATPYRPTGLSTETRVLVRLIDEVVWLAEILKRMPLDGMSGTTATAVHELELAASEVLEGGANALQAGRVPPDALSGGLRRLQDARAAMEQAVTRAPYPVNVPASQGGVTTFVSSLEPGFRAQEVSFAVSAIVTNIELYGAVRVRRWWERVLGQRPVGVTSPLSTVHERAGAHVDHHSVWLHNSLRGAVALGLAVLIAELTGVQHSFWVVSGTLAVLRSNAFQTGQTALRALLGNVAGIIVASGLIFTLGSNITVFWLLLPLAIAFTGLAPAAFSFAVGQAGFTATLLILFNIIEPVGWGIGLVRLEDVAIGCAVSAGVGFLFWPRGAGAALGQAVAEAFAESARYLRTAVAYGVTRCDSLVRTAPVPHSEKRAAAAAARRLDDAFRGFLGERGTKRLPLATVTVLITAVAVLRLTADSILDLWERDEPFPAGDRTAARKEILESGTAVCNWYQQAARALAGYAEVPEALPGEPARDVRLISAVRRDLSDQHGLGTRTAVKVIWTADHIDVARQLQTALVEPARAAAVLRHGTNSATRHRLTRWRPQHTAGD